VIADRTVYDVCGIVANYQTGFGYLSPVLSTLTTIVWLGLVWIPRL